MVWSTSDRSLELPSNWESKIQPEILKRDSYKCKINLPGCEVEATEVDHKVRGNDHSYKNLQAVCTRCHAKKSSREGHSAKAKLKKLRSRPRERHPGLRG
jgi:5-methylcytosine-specific restriction endonuclease McrA